MYKYKCKVIKVVDGDTVDVDIDLGFGVWLKNQRVRLHGIDAPESRTRDKREKKFGLLAKNFLIRELGETCVLETKKDKKGKFGRILGIFHGYDFGTQRWMSINDIMIRDKLVVAYYGQSKDSIKEDHEKNFAYLEENGEDV